MTLQGERFVIDFSDDEDGDVPEQPGPSFDFVADIKERTPAAPTPPSLPRLTSTATGFPQPRKRNVKSAFKREREQASGAAPAPADATPARPKPSTLRPDKESLEREDKRAIDEENKRRLADMAPAQIKREREELMSSLPQSLMERFLRRPTLDDEDEMNNQVLSGHGFVPDVSSKESKGDSSKPTKSVKFDVPESRLEPSRQPQVEDEEEAQEDEVQQDEVQQDEVQQDEVQQDEVQQDEVQQDEVQQEDRVSPEEYVNDDMQPAQPVDLLPASEPPTGRVHFPRPPPRNSPMPNLDPSSPSFLSDLQAHYFPETPHDPSSLSWLDPASDGTPVTSAYHAESTATTMGPAAVRFSLKGNILAPRTSLSLPTTLGLHHHGDDPDAAGYTIPEMAIFTQSSLPAQRCLAWQVLGRLLYRLGKGEFGERGDRLVEGLWDVVERERVVGRMLAEAGGGDGNAGDKSDTSSSPQGRAGGIGKHASARAWATEAIWLWKQGGGGDRGFLKEGQFRSD